MSDPDPIENEEVLHEYDGIEELDNKLPRWWLWLFFISMAFAPVYLIYSALPGNSSHERWQAEMAIAEAERALLLADFNPMEEPPNNDPAILAKGEALFATKTCIVCHRADGGGMPGLGPNLCDDYYVNGHTFQDTVNVLLNGGRPGTAMVAFSSQINPKDIHTLASYVWFELHGSNPENAKEPEGEHHPRDPDSSEEAPTTEPVPAEG